MNEALAGAALAGDRSGAGVADAPASEFSGPYNPLDGFGQVVSCRSEPSAMQLEGRLHQQDEIGAPGDEQGFELWDGLGESQVAQVHGDQLHRLWHQVRIQAGEIDAFE